MPHLLLELFSEEIPARMQNFASNHLKKAVTDALVNAGLPYEGAVSFVTPRRLALAVHGVPARSPDRVEERKGPSVNAPSQALEGFLKSAGLTSLDQAHKHNDPKKGEFYVAHLKIAGKSAEEIIASFMPEIIKTFPWAKSQRWGAGTLKWVRPLHSILCTFGSETEEPEVIHFEVEGIKSSNVTHGHRFHAPNEIIVRRLDDYISSLTKACVIAKPEERVQKIMHDAKTLCFAQGLELVEDAALAEEVAGLVEYPVVLMGSFDPEFLNIPPEVIRTTIRANQKCFVVKKGDKLTNKFIITSNIEATDGGAAIIAGNERVIRARLSDAKFFFETDKAKPLTSRLDKFKTITYHKDIGSQYERIERIAALAVQIGSGLDRPLVQNAARLAKADLVTEMVGEFPELEGLMGKYYYQHENPEDKTDTASAIEQHYRPKGPSDKIPDTRLGQVIAIADKLDQLIGFWTINEKPTGSKDPFALRRAALGIIRIVLETGEFADFHTFIPSEVKDDLMKFMMERFKTQMLESGKRHDVIDAVMANNSGYNFKAIAKNIESLSKFISQDTYLLPLFNRVNNILKAEEKKGKINFIEIEKIDTSLANESLVKADLLSIKTQLLQQNSNFYNKLSALNDSFLFQHFTHFFTNVMINSDIPEERLHRLSLLAEYRKQCLAVADFTKIVS